MKEVRGFIDFIREQGVVGLAVGFILGGAISKVVASLVNDVINPLISVLFGFAGEIKAAALQIGPIRIAYGNFVAVLVDFIVIAFVVYYGVKIIGLDRIDKKKE